MSTATSVLPRKLPSIENIAKGNIPKDLSELDRWVLWARSQQTGTKVPYSVNTRKPCDVTDAAVCVSFDEAIEAYTSSPNKFDGIGFAFHPAIADAPRLIGIDVDRCLTEHGQLKPAWASVPEGFENTYIEVSPRGFGIHLYAYGFVDRGVKFEYLDGRIEVFASGYLTFTSRSFNNSPLNIDHCQSAIERILSLGRAHQPAKRDNNSAGEMRQVHNLARYTDSAISSAVRSIEMAGDGAQRKTLNDCSFAVGQLAQYVDLAATEARLIDAGMRMTNTAAQWPWTLSCVTRTVRTGFRDGSLSPRVLTPTPRAYSANRRSV